MTEIFDDRATELETLEAIYGDSFVAGNACTGCVEVPVALQIPLRVLCNDERGGNDTVSYLPPLRVQFELPGTYPARSAPIVRLEVDWLPKDNVQSLEKHVQTLWEEYGRAQVMYAYISYVQEASETAFGLDSLGVDNTLFSQLLQYDQDAKLNAFQKGTYECGVCLDPKKGTMCHQMEACSHVFCVECLQGYYNNAILTGNINDVKCPAFDCETGDKRTQRAQLVTPRELLRIPIERPAVRRYVNLRRKKKLESDKSTIWCPRQWCQGAMRGNNYPRSDVPLEDMGVVYEEDATPVVPVIQDSEEMDEKEAEAIAERRLLASRLQICEDCSYAFCRLCRHTWHGDFFDCRARVNIPSERTILEKEEEASLEFIRQNTTKCPKCETPVQKSEACNHMTCVQCRTHFCYLCSTFLNPFHPYDHFNLRGSFCYQRLWEGQNGEGVER